MIIDPTDRAGVVGDWRFDPDDPAHAGWREQYTAFDRAHREPLIRFVTAVAGRNRLAESDQSPEAVAQVALTKAALRWPELAAMDKPRSWLYTVAANLVRTAAAARHAARGKTAVVPGWTSVSASGPAHRVPGPGEEGPATADTVEASTRGRVDDEVVDRLALAPVARSVDDLPIRQRIAVYLTAEGFTAPEVAQVLGCNSREVASLLRGGRSTARRALVRVGYIVGGVAGGAMALAAVFLFGRALVDVVRQVRVPELDAAFWWSVLSFVLTTAGSLVTWLRTRVTSRAVGEMRFRLRLPRIHFEADLSALREPKTRPRPVTGRKGSQKRRRRSRRR